MPFLRDDSLTFHRFAPTEVPSIGATPPTNNSPAPSTSSSCNPPFYDRDEPDTAPTCHNSHKMSKQHGSPKITSTNRAGFGSSGKELSSFPSSVWTTNTGTLTPVTSHGHHNSMYKNSYTIEANDFQYIPSSSAGGSVSERRKSTPQQNGSTTKLVLADDDQTNKQVSSKKLGVCFHRGIRYNIIAIRLHITLANKPTSSYENTFDTGTAGLIYQAEPCFGLLGISSDRTTHASEPEVTQPYRFAENRCGAVKKTFL